MNGFIPTVLASLVFLTSCTQFRRQRVSPARTMEEFAARSLKDPAFLAFLEAESAADLPWNVEKLSLAAVYFHPDLALARAEADEAAAKIRTAGMRPNPVLTFSPQYATFRAPPFTPWFFGANVQVPFETAGKRAKRTDQAVAAAEAARLRVSVRAWASRSRVRSAMLELYGARQNGRLLEAEQQLHASAIRKLNAQMDAGEVSPFELTQARLMANRTRLALEDARRVAATAQTRLASAVGVPTRALEGIKLDFTGFDQLPSPHLSRRRALTERPDLLALLADYAAAEHALRLEVAKQYPDVTLGPGYDYNSGQNRWQLGVSLPVPLNRNHGPIAEAESRRVTAEKRFLAQQAAIEGELDIALAAYQASRSKVATAGQLAKDAATSSEATQSMVRAGAVSGLEFTRRQIEACAANLALQSARIEAQIAAGALEDAMQSPLR
jgi:cobalt-zinc-cadmium efflux system outer membrane protein